MLVIKCSTGEASDCGPEGWQPLPHSYDHDFAKTAAEVGDRDVQVALEQAIAERDKVQDLGTRAVQRSTAA